MNSLTPQCSGPEARVARSLAADRDVRCQNDTGREFTDRRAR